MGRAFDTDPGGEPAEAAGCLQRLGGYRIEGELGRGGMGVVYRAFDEKLADVAVALKTMKRADSTAILRTSSKSSGPWPTWLSSQPGGGVHELTRGRSLSWFFTMELVEGVDFLKLCAMGDRADSPAPGDDRRPRDRRALHYRGLQDRPRVRSATPRILRPEAGQGEAPAFELMADSAYRRLSWPGCESPSCNWPRKSPFSMRRSKLHPARPETLKRAGDQAGPARDS